MNSGRLRVLLLMCADALCVASAWALCVVGYKFLGSGSYRLEDYLSAWPVIGLFIGVNFISKTYHGRATYPAMPLSPVEELRRLVLSALITHLMVMAFLGFGRQVETVSRFVLIAAGLLTAATAQMFRDAFRLLMARTGIGIIPAYLVGDGMAAERLLGALTKSSYLGFRIVRRFSKEELREVVPSAAAADIKHLFCCYRDDRYFRAQMPDFIGQFSYIEYLPTESAFPLSDARVLDIDGLGGLELVNQRRQKLLRVEKRLLDLALATVIGLMTLPLFVIVPVLIKLTSRGPVFYRARRLGKQGREIRVWKFRSMYRDADARLQALLDSDPALAAEFRENFKLRNDPRITPIGRFLRKTSIDELPQLINVFFHDMALIGPRPIVEAEIPYYGKAYELFSSVHPGVTGLWQASGRSDSGYSLRVALDVRYVLNWSPWLDLWIVYRTVAAVIRMKGSY